MAAEVGPIEVISKPAAEKSVEETGKKFYAWSPIHYDATVDDNGHITERMTIQYGDEVSQKTLGITDENWDRLVALKVIRKSVPPKVGRYDSPKRALIKDAARQMEIALAGGE